MLLHCPLTQACPILRPLIQPAPDLGRKVWSLAEGRVAVLRACQGLIISGEASGISSALKVMQN